MEMKKVSLAPSTWLCLRVHETKLGEDMQRAQQKLVIAFQSKATTLKNDLLKDRESRRLEQLKANAEIRRRALQADQIQTSGQNNG